MAIPAAAQYDVGFRPLLADCESGALEDATGTVYGLWPDLTLAFMNPAWFRFAAENRGEPAIFRCLAGME
jgi:hypothetical protein